LRQTRWSPGADGGLVTVDLDATIVIARSDKQEASPTWKKTYGFHPMAAFADHGESGNGEPLAILLRAGSAGPDTAADHIETTRLALAQLPRHLRRRVLVRTDSAGGTHGFLEWLTAGSRRLHYSVGMTITEDMQAAILELRHRRRARCEDRIRCAMDTGLRNLPLHSFAQNQLWCEIVSLACELLAWTQLLALTGTARRWEPKRLRLRLFSAAGRLARSGRRPRLRLAERWPWASEVTAAVTRLQALPSG
jgi:Transposase DDE domain group 1